MFDPDITNPDARYTTVGPQTLSAGGFTEKFVFGSSGVATEAAMPFIGIETKNTTAGSSGILEAQYYAWGRNGR